MRRRRGEEERVSRAQPGGNEIRTYARVGRSAPLAVAVAGVGRVEVGGPHAVHGGLVYTVQRVSTAAQRTTGAGERKLVLAHALAPAHSFGFCFPPPYLCPTHAGSSATDGTNHADPPLPRDLNHPICSTDSVSTVRPRIFLRRMPALRTTQRPNFRPLAAPASSICPIRHQRISWRTTLASLPYRDLRRVQIKRGLRVRGPRSE